MRACIWTSVPVEPASGARLQCMIMLITRDLHHGAKINCRYHLCAVPLLSSARTGAGGDNGIDQNKKPLRFPHVSEFLRSHYLISTRTRSYCCGRLSSECPRHGGGCDARSCFLETNPGWERFALPGETAGAGAREVRGASLVWSGRSVWRMNLYGNVGESQSLLLFFS
eukprot:COSAG01_NODE_5390_length_4291_cov_3.107109_1_plen_169_part_00